MATFIKDEAAASPPAIETHDSINVAPPSRRSADSFSRRGISPARPGSDSQSAIPRSANHRPSNIILPPKRLSEYEEFERGSNPRSGSHTGSNANTPNSSAFAERKRSFPFELETRSSDGDDEPPTARYAPMAMSLPMATPGPDGAHADTICFCVKAPKVPRPRNAFILYRQHYQSQVVAENPGLANPDISKIIGGMWKGQTDKDREYWKGLAEQEKQHHRKQHPDYRYQPRRTGKGDARGARPGSATGEGFDKGMGSGDAMGDPNRCEKCGGRYIAPLPSARAVPMSARALNQPPSPYTSGRRGSGPQSAFPSIHGDGPGDERLAMARGLPSPRMPKPTPTSQQRDPSGRHPLPQHGRPTSDGYDPRSMACADSDQKRRRYEPPNPYAPRFDTNGNHIATPIHPHPQYRLPPRGHRQGASPPPMSAGPQYSNGGPGGPGPVPGSPWMAPPPVPQNMQARHSYPAPSSARGQNFPPEGRHPDEGEGYNGRLPPIQGASYSYHSGPGNGLSTPSTAMVGLSMRQPPTPTSATPMSARPPMSAIGANGRGPGRRDQFPHRPSSFSDESLRLPPLMTNVSTPISALSQKHLQQQQQQQQQQQNQVQKSQGQKSQDQRPESAPPGRLQSMALASGLAKNSTVPYSKDRETDGQGIRAMVLSVPYLVRLEYLRRMNPPQSATTGTRRGPIISIEGHNTALTDDVGRIVEQALRQSGECHLGVWSTSSPTKKHSTDSGVGIAIDDGADSSTESVGDDLLAEYQALVVSWRTKTKSIVRHVNTTDAASIPAESIEKDEPAADAADATEAAPPSPAKSNSESASAQPSPHSSMSPEADEAKKDSESSKNKETSASSSASTSPRQSPCMTGSSIAGPPSSHADQPLIPTALITGGYSLSISDRYAIKVPIPDSYTPLDHWEWMAMMWRATAAPDLVIYVDGETGDSDAGDDQPSVNTRAQDGVIVVNASKADAENRGDGKDRETKDWTDSRVLDKKTERRLTFEVMEWVRSFGYGA